MPLVSVHGIVENMTHLHLIIVVELRRPRKKLSRGGVGVFQYAKTVENNAWGNEGTQKDLQVRDFSNAL